MENRGVKVDGVKQRSGWWAEWQGARILVCTPVPPLSYPLSWAMRNKSRPETAAILLRLLPQRGQLSAARLASFTPRVLQASMLHTTHPASFTPLILRPLWLHTTRPVSLHASHHTSCKPILLHTTRPASLHASHHSPCELHTTRPASLQASHHTSCKPILLYTTRPASFTPLRIQGCVTDRGIQKSLPFFVFATQFPKLPASFIPLSSNNRVTTDGVHEARAGAPLCTDAFHPCR